MQHSGCSQHCCQVVLVKQVLHLAALLQCMAGSHHATPTVGNTTRPSRS